MFQKDFLLKTVQQFIEAILRLLKLISIEEETFIIDFNNFLLKSIKIDLKTLLLTESQIIKLQLENMTGFNDISSQLRLLFLSTYKLKNISQEEKIKLIKIGFDLTHKEEYKVFDLYIISETQHTISKIMANENLFVSLYPQLIRYHLENKNAERFEDELFFHVSKHNNKTKILCEIANSFYTELESLSNSTLNAQGFNRQEIQQGRNDFFTAINSLEDE